MGYSEIAIDESDRGRGWEFRFRSARDRPSEPVSLPQNSIRVVAQELSQSRGSIPRMPQSPEELWVRTTDAVFSPAGGGNMLYPILSSSNQMRMRVKGR